jgi:transcriptional regulator GlxA family with amidase domain
MSPRTVVFIVFDEFKLLDVAGPAEVFAEANRFGADYRLEIASVDGRDVVTSIGTSFAVTTKISAVERADTVIVAGGDPLVRQPIQPELLASVKRMRTRTRRLASICTGSFVLAQAGFLNGRRATTHWRQSRRLACVYPDVIVEPDAIYVRDEDVFTSAGVSAGIDLALALVEMDYDSTLARSVARSLVVYVRRSGGQSQFSVLIEADPPSTSALRAAVDAISADPTGEHTVRSLARHASVSARQLTRLFQEELGTSPARFVKLVRIDAARVALEEGNSIARSAQLSGFGTPETMRRAFIKHLGLSPKAYQDRFRTTSYGRVPEPIRP